MKNNSKLLNEITKLYKNSKMEKGDKYVAQVVDNMSDFDKLVCLGNRYFYQREFQQAIECYQEATLLCPNEEIARYQYLTGKQKEVIGDNIIASQYYQAAINTEPEFVEAYNELGVLLILVEDYDMALSCFRDGLKISSNDSEILLNLRGLLEFLVNLGRDELSNEYKEINIRCAELNLL